MRNSKRREVRHFAVCFMSTLVSKVAGRKRTRVLAVLRWSEGEKARISQEFLLNQLDPAEECGELDLAPGQLSVLLPGANYCRRWCEHVKHLVGSSSQLLYSTEGISLSQTWRAI